MHGHGEYCWGDGHKYIGQFVNGKQHGHGVYTWPSGGQYNGQWRDDQMNGFGRYARNDGILYVGYWKDDHQFGLGVKMIPELVCYGPDKKMFRKRKFKEVWAEDKTCLLHQEIQIYPDLMTVLVVKKKLFDIEIICQERDEEEEREMQEKWKKEAEERKEREEAREQQMKKQKLFASGGHALLQ